jgi:hypothetical protein
VIAYDYISVTREKWTHSVNYICTPQCLFDARLSRHTPALDVSVLSARVCGLDVHAALYTHGVAEFFVRFW